MRERRELILGIVMKALAHIPLILAVALFGLQPAFACCCLADPAAQAQEPAAGVAPCHEAPETGQADAQSGASTHCEGCADCADFESVPAVGANQALTASELPAFKLPPAVAHNPAAAVRPQTIRIIGPPAAVPRAAQTPVLLKQRLLN